MKRVLCSILLAAILSIYALLLTGCHSLGEMYAGAGLAIQRASETIIGEHGSGETISERIDRHSRQLQIEGSMVVDDEDAFWHLDRPSRLSEYTVR
jgi:hypothetical protein